MGVGQQSSPEGVPFGEHVWLESTTVRHRIVGFLSSRWLELQRSRPIASTLLVWRSRPDLSQVFAVFTMGHGFTINSCLLTLLLLARVQSLPRAVLSRSLSSSLRRGLPLLSSLDPAPLRPSHGVSYPSATSGTGSDLHRVYLTRLCCTLRFSQPLGAFFRPNRPALFHADAT